MKGIVYGASHRDRNETWRWDVLIPAEEIAGRAEHQPEVIGPFMRDEARQILEL